MSTDNMQFLFDFKPLVTGQFHSSDPQLMSKLTHKLRYLPFVGAIFLLNIEIIACISLSVLRVPLQEISDTKQFRAD